MNTLTYNDIFEYMKTRQVQANSAFTFDGVSFRQQDLSKSVIKKTDITNLETVIIYYSDDAYACEPQLAMDINFNTGICSGYIVNINRNTESHQVQLEKFIEWSPSFWKFLKENYREIYDRIRILRNEAINKRNAELFGKDYRSKDMSPKLDMIHYYSKY